MTERTPKAGRDRRGFHFYVDAGLLDWLDSARWSLEASKTDVAATALEYYLATVAPEKRPPDYEVSAEVQRLLRERGA